MKGTTEMTSPIQIDDMPIGTQNFRSALNMIATNPRPDIIQTAVSSLSEDECRTMFNLVTDLEHFLRDRAITFDRITDDPETI